MVIKQDIRLDITALMSFVKTQNLMLYPIMIYMLARVMNETQQKAKPINPNYAVQEPSGNGYMYWWTTYDKIFSGFYHQYINDWLLFADKENKNTKTEVENSLFHVFLEEEKTADMGSPYPSFILKQMETAEDKTFLTLSIVCQNTAFNIKSIVQALQLLADTFEQWIDT